LPTESRTISSKLPRSSCSCSKTDSSCRSRHLRFVVALGQHKNHQRSVRRVSSIRTGQNPESACGTWGQVAHLDHEREREQGLDQPGRGFVFGRCPGLVRNSAFRLNRQKKRSNCCRLKRRAIPSTANQRSREAHCGVRVPVGCPEADRSGPGETEAVQPATRHLDPHRVTIVTNPPFCAPHRVNCTSTSRSGRGGSIPLEREGRSIESS
jgi:hypothetical protein